jgi:hypothetical protein
LKKKKGKERERERERERDAQREFVTCVTTRIQSMAALEDLKKEKEKQRDSNSVSRHHVCNRQSYKFTAF